MEGLRMGVAGKAQQSCGFGGKPAPGVGKLHCHVKLTLEGRGSWSMTPVLTSSPLFEAKSTSPTSVTHPVHYRLPCAVSVCCYFRYLYFINSSDCLPCYLHCQLYFVFLMLPFPFLFFVPPPPFSPLHSLITFCPISPLLVRVCY